MKPQKNRAFGHKIGIFLLPAVIWAALFYLRAHFYVPFCGQDPSLCTQDQVNALDRLVFELGSIRADFWSNVVQNVVGGIAFLLPFLIYSRNRWREALSEFSLLASISLWNGVGLEVVRALVQRPRPLVFNSPTTDGMNIHQYTSFYSGHTSFVALASLAMWFMIRRRFPNQIWLHLNFFLLFITTSVLTGALRVIGGRHYPTDVIAGFLIGAALTFGFNLFQNRSTKTQIAG